MMMSEFIERTGFEPTASEYAEIEDAYYDFDDDKDAFCKAFVKQGGEKKICQARAAEIARLKSQIVEMEKMFKADNEKQEKRIAAIQAQLDKELDWRPCDDCGTNMSQERYEELLEHCTGNHGDPHDMSEDEARKLVAEECGFDPDRIRIVGTVHTYEVNKYRQLRKAAAYTRIPLYDATDYNYVRFDVECAACTWAYEMVNGELRQYNC